MESKYVGVLMRVSMVTASFQGDNENEWSRGGVAEKDVSMNKYITLECHVLINEFMLHQ